MRWLLGAIALLLLAIVLGFGLLAYAMYALVGVILLSRLAADAWSEQLTARREINRDHIHVGDTVAVVITFENRGWLPVPWLLVEDLLPPKALVHNPPNLKVMGRRLQLVWLRSNARKTVHYQLTCNRRGYYQLGPLMAETGDVFGLYRRYRIMSEPSYLLATPRVIPLEGFDIASRRPIGEVRMSHRLYEDPTRIAGVRSYQPGDPLNRIHWSATARTGQLHSKVYEPSTVAGATILLDFHDKSFDRENEPVRSELAITTAASLAGAICQMGQQVGLVSNGRDAADRIRIEGWRHEQLPTRQRAREVGAMGNARHRLQPLIVPTLRGAEQLKRILEVLARIEKSDGLSVAQLVHESSGRIPASATVIAIVRAVPPETAIALGNLRRRGFAVTAIVNAYEAYEYAEVAAPLVAQRVETRHLRDETSITTLCSNVMGGRPTDFVAL